ncbi:MAG: alpha-galactosidase [Gorillibacterium sp.]|nr:alpha-galactosidase [Gorillibacterium sp.]
MSIEYVESTRMWILNTKKTSYVMGLNQLQQLQHIYWGARLPYSSDYMITEAGSFGSQECTTDIINLEYPAWGGMIYSEPCLKVTFADKVRDLVLAYDSYAITNQDIPELTIRLRDPYNGLVVDLHYKAFEELDVVERYVEIINTGSDPVDLEQAQSAVWSIPGNHEYRLTHLAGKWLGETQVKQSVLTEGKKVLESRRGTTSNHANPWFAIDRGQASEYAGDVWFGALSWSGNWKITAEVTPFYAVRVTGGVNDFDFTYQLQPGESFSTPVFTGGFTTDGFGQASRNMHRYQLERLLPREHAGELRKVLYNSWEATLFNVTEKDQIKLAEKAALLGVELFVVDDGWFGQRSNDEAGLGDWYVNKEKFPHGLQPLISRCNELGMEFGLWVEPEMVNPDSDLYRQHPDWVMHFPNRPRTESRTQLVLNLGREDVREYIYGFLHDLLQNHNIRFIKWDMNRPFSEPGWPNAPTGRDKEIWVRYVEGLYLILDRLKAEHSSVEIETCASGGGRVDNGILSRTDQAWTSDNTNAYERLFIQEGYSYAYCAKTMVAWVTDSGNPTLPLTYRFHSAMMGTLGIGSNLHHWSDEQLATATTMIQLYKDIRHIVQHGSLYRLSSPRKKHQTAVQYVTADLKESVVFVLSTNQAPFLMSPPLQLSGLDPNQLYQLEGFDVCRSGKSLMAQGIQVAMNGFFQSKIIRIIAV